MELNEQDRNKLQRIYSLLHELHGSYHEPSLGLLHELHSLCHTDHYLYFSSINTMSSFYIVDTSVCNKSIHYPYLVQQTEDQRKTIAYYLYMFMAGSAVRVVL